MKNKLIFLFSLFLMFHFSGDSSAAGASQAIIPPVCSTLSASPVPTEFLGTTGYYRWRHGDFMRRHPDLREPDPGHIPDYYLAYGEKYVLRFSQELFPRLSDKGKEWLVKTRLNLQVAIENRRKAGDREFTQLEEDPPSFRKFAFNTHVPAYMDAGLADLPLSDLLKIVATPEMKDILRKDGRTQIFTITRRLGVAYWKRLLSLTRSVQAQLSSVIREGNHEPVEQVLEFVETLSPSDQKMIRFVSGNYQELREAIQFQASHANDTATWRQLLKRLNELAGKNEP